MILGVKLVMSVATLLFAAGLIFRHRNNLWHRKLMMAGFATTLGIAIVLVVGVNGFGSTYSPAVWLVGMTSAAVARWILILHRVNATVTFLLLILQAISGYRRSPLHNRLYPATIGFWLISYFSGLVIFQ